MTSHNDQRADTDEEKQGGSLVPDAAFLATDHAGRGGLADGRTSLAAKPGPHQGPVGELLVYLNSHSVAEKAQAWQQETASPAPAYPELPAIDYFQKTWERLRTRRQLQTSQEQVPDNAGPLNSSNLVHRSLSLMREVSPGYLQHFLTYVDTLSWLEETDASEESVGKGGKVRAGKAKKPPRTR